MISSIWPQIRVYPPHPRCGKASGSERTNIKPFQLAKQTLDVEKDEQVPQRRLCRRSWLLRELNDLGPDLEEETIDITKPMKARLVPYGIKQSYLASDMCFIQSSGKD